ncbi:hypothetical protein WH96_07090 [Kiloniella spongiae]|uniref:Uncharacterized protein n=1 Tax=Kiloniella spongiae TaxID=1489064 RepID=A0A0H2MXK4_9PROT|nr:hypothetical protein [Kiloniella spongiae]KLN61395.1 hypothetical protein WH96_07090 [Kiloniella spongiae]
MNLKCALKWGFLLYLTYVPIAFAAEGIKLKGISVHYAIASDDPDVARLGAYPKLTRYNLHNDAAPAKIDVVVNLEGNITADVILNIVPVVGKTDWSVREGITDLELLESSKVEFTNIVHLEKKISASDDKQIVFQGINLDELIGRFTMSDLWPRQLIFKVGLVPHETEDDISDNLGSYILTLDPPD